MSENSVKSDSIGHQPFTARDILLALILKYDGCWESVFSDIQNKVKVSDKQIDNSRKMGYQFLCILDDKYPEILKPRTKPPFILFYEGNIDYLNNTKLSILNSNQSSDYAMKSVLKICNEIEGATFVLSFGNRKNRELIKAIADKGGKIIAILDSGIGVENSLDSELYEMLKKDHLILSLYPKNVKKTQETAVFSAKLLATISDDILVGGVSKKSFESCALGFAIGENTEVYCVPFQIGSNYINNELISQGAHLIENGKEIRFRTGEHYDV